MWTWTRADNVYTVATTATNSDIGGLASDGAPLFLTTPNPAYFNENVIVADTLGNLWTANTTSTGAVLEYSATSGSLENTITADNVSTSQPAGTPITSPFGLAIDHSNDVYFVQQGSGTTVQYIPRGTATAQGTTLNGGAAPNIAGVPSLISLDPTGDVFTNETSSTSTTLFHEDLTKLGPATCTPPDFCGYLGAPTGSMATYGTTYTSLFDSTGSVWTNSTTTLYKTTYNPYTGISVAKTVPLTAGATCWKLGRSTAATRSSSRITRPARCTSTRRRAARTSSWRLAMRRTEARTATRCRPSIRRRMCAWTARALCGSAIREPGAWCTCSALELRPGRRWRMGTPR